MQASPTENKKESQVLKIPYKTLNNSQRKCKMQKFPNPNHPGNPGHSEKMKPKDNR